MSRLISPRCRHSLRISGACSAIRGVQAAAGNIAQSEKGGVAYIGRSGTGTGSFSANHCTFSDNSANVSILPLYSPSSISMHSS